MSLCLGTSLDAINCVKLAKENSCSQTASAWRSALHFGSIWWSLQHFPWPPVWCSYSFSFSGLTQFHRSLKNFYVCVLWFTIMSVICMQACDCYHLVYIIVKTCVYVTVARIHNCSCVIQMQTPRCYCGCSVISFILLYFLLLLPIQLSHWNLHSLPLSVWNQVQLIWNLNTMCTIVSVCGWALFQLLEITLKHCSVCI